jgi:hypothetical protein
MMRAVAGPQSLSSFSSLRFGSGCVAALLALTSAVLPIGGVALAQVAQTPAQTPAQAQEPAPAASADSDETSTDDPNPELAWDLGHRRYSTWGGTTGGLFLFDARAAEPGAVRVQFGMDAFAGSSYLNSGDHLELTDQTLALNVTLIRALEAYATLSNRSVNQSRPLEKTLDVLGDFSLGARLGTPLGKLFDLGADLRASFTNSVGGGGLDWGATSLSLRAALSADLQRLPRPLPLLFRVNAGYTLDNTAQVVKDTENANYAKLSNAESKADETRHLVSRLQRFAMNINRLDRLTLGVGVEAPLRIVENFYLHPLLEWQMAVPVNRQGYDCPNTVGTENLGTRRSDQDGCYERMTSALPMNLAVGVRVVPPARGLSALFAVDIGLSGTDRFVRELTPNLPWRFLAAISYDYDARPVRAPTVTAPVVVAAPPPPAPAVAVAAPRGRILGKVTTADQRPIADARVYFVDRKLTTLLSNEAGEFATEPFEPGEVALEVRHPDFDTSKCPAVIPPDGQDVHVQCTLTVAPITAKVQGQVFDAAGELLAPARVILSGQSNAVVMSDARGQFALEQLVAGTYQLRVEIGGYFIRQLSFAIASSGTMPLTVNVTRKPIAPSITFIGDVVEAPTLAYPTETSTQLTAAGLAAVAEVADLLLSRPDLSVQIQGFGATEELGKLRATAVKQRLMEAGVPDTHIEAIGGNLRKFRFVLHR